MDCRPAFAYHRQSFPDLLLSYWPLSLQTSTIVAEGRRPCAAITWIFSIIGVESPLYHSAPTASSLAHADQQLAVYQPSDRLRIAYHDCDCTAISSCRRDNYKLEDFSLIDKGARRFLGQECAGGCPGLSSSIFVWRFWRDLRGWRGRWTGFPGSKLRDCGEATRRTGL